MPHVINSYLQNVVENCTLVHGRYPKVQYRHRFLAAYPHILDLRIGAVGIGNRLRERLATAQIKRPDNDGRSSMR